MASPQATEKTPLFANDDTSAEEQSNTSNTSKALVINASKVCLGSGVLTMPYACSMNHGGGYLFSAFGLYLVAQWNYYITRILTECADVATTTLSPKSNGMFRAAPMYSKIAFVTFGGDRAIHAIDIIMYVE